MTFVLLEWFNFVNFLDNFGPHTTKNHVFFSFFYNSIQTFVNELSWHIHKFLKTKRTKCWQGHDTSKVTIKTSQKNGCETLEGHKTFEIHAVKKEADIFFSGTVWPDQFSDYGHFGCEFLWIDVFVFFHRWKSSQYQLSLFETFATLLSI